MWAYVCECSSHYQPIEPQPFTVYALLYAVANPNRGQLSILLFNAVINPVTKQTIIWIPNHKEKMKTQTTKKRLLGADGKNELGPPKGTPNFHDICLPEVVVVVCTSGSKRHKQKETKRRLDAMLERR